MSIDKIVIDSHSSSYSVLFDDELKMFQNFSNELNTFYLIDQKVWNLYKPLFFNKIPSSQVLKIEAIEENKDFFALGNIIRQLTTVQAKKNLTIVAIGGGIIQDISGFIASILYRGIRWIYIPTTLLAQADSCIGAKTSINFEKHKNLLGTFWAPQEIWLSTKFIDTLETKDFYSGIGEIVKLFLIDGKTSLSYFDDFSFQSETDFRNNIKELLKPTLLIKKRFIEEDEYDKGIRNILNYGHCIGHAIESVTNYAIPHGQAVTLGMIWANIVSVKTQLLSTEKMNHIYSSYLKKSHTISKDLISFDANQIISAMKRDKKREGQDLAIILMDDNSNFNRIIDLKEKVIADTFNEFYQLIVN